MASALAYQFGLQFGESKSRSFRFVVIDEAFGRGSDESTRYGLELFKKLNLQLLIVTPLQKIHVIEGHVNSFHFVSNREGNNSQVSNFTKEEYEKEQLFEKLSYYYERRGYDNLGRVTLRIFWYPRMSTRKIIYSYNTEGKQHIKSEIIDYRKFWD